MGEHIHERMLFDAAQDCAPLAKGERAHLRECGECLELFRVFARGKTSSPPKADDKNDDGNAA